MFKIMQITDQLRYYNLFTKSMQRFSNKDLPMVELKINCGKINMDSEEK